MNDFKKEKGKKLAKEFYQGKTVEVAKSLLGKYIVRLDGTKKIIGKIIETEAYLGPNDKAAHSYKGKVTPRNKIEYSEGGFIYIYLVYGMHWQLNIVTEEKGKPECVLIRALHPKDGRLFSANGPGKLCRYLRLDKSFYGENLASSKRIWLEDRNEVLQPSQILEKKRIGIDYAGQYWSRRKLRFLIKRYKKYLPK